MCLQSVLLFGFYALAEVGSVFRTTNHYDIREPLQGYYRMGL